MKSVEEVCLAAKHAAGAIGLETAERKNEMLRVVCAALKENASGILKANAEDVSASERAGKPKHFLDRLALNERRIGEIADGVVALIDLKDPVGERIERWKVPNGLDIEKVRVPLGVVGIIYEARPNVTVDAIALCLKSGNAVVLRGSSEAIRTNTELVRTVKTALAEKGFESECVQLVEDVTREGVGRMMKLNGVIDVLIPRGGAALIQNVVQNATVPVIQTGVGNCHIYVEKSADFDEAVKIAVTAKVSRPSVCNAAESLLVDREIAQKFLPLAFDALSARGVRVLGCAETCALLPLAEPATEEDFYREFNDYIISVKVVGGVREAVAHINRYGTQHSEAIVTKDQVSAELFLNEVDAACVYVNASTRFTDGFQFGFGAEMGISTQKLHARGPMGLSELTTYKYKVRGTGQVRE